ncbi:MAG: glutamyl-tRNA reductase [Burkholderiales bacterium]
MQLYTFGINHQTAPVEIREKVAFPPERLADALRELAKLPSVYEAAILSTCNRTEIYCRSDAPEEVLQWLKNFHHLAKFDLAPFVYSHQGMQSVQHAFRVASGLDSMVLGETQILGQLKDAVRIAEQAGTLGNTLHPFFQRTFAVAKEVRARTQIGASSVSMAAAGVRLAGSIFDDWSRLNILFIGAGDMIDLTAQHFAAKQPNRITIANRTLERGQSLAQKFHGQAIALADLPQHLAANDIVVSCTASTLPLLGKGLVERAIKARKHRPMFMLDLAVPRDIEPEVGQLNDVFLYTVDDLAGVVREGRNARQGAVADAQAIIDRHVAEFVHWQETREQVPVIRQLRDHAESYKQFEIERARKALARGEDPQTVLEQLGNSLINKFLHHPTRILRDAEGAEREKLSELLDRLYVATESDGGNSE